MAGIRANEQRHMSSDAPTGIAPCSVLVVEDEPIVRLIICSMLNDLGHSACEVSSAEHALEILEGSCSVDLIITDYWLEGMTGGQLMAALRQHHGKIPVILATGDIAQATGMEAAILRKPFFMEDLDGAIRHTIGERNRR